MILKSQLIMSSKTFDSNQFSVCTYFTEGYRSHTGRKGGETWNGCCNVKCDRGLRRYSLTPQPLSRFLAFALLSLSEHF